MEIYPFPPRLDTSYVLDGLLADDEVPQILSGAQRRYKALHSALTWSEIRWQKEVAIHKTGFICLYQALADWLKVHKVTPRNLQDESGSIPIRSPATIRSERVATELDLAFLFAALAVKLEYHASLMLKKNAGVHIALLALTTETDVKSAIESGALHTLTFLPAFEKYPGDSRGSDRYYEASIHNLKKDACYLVIPLETTDVGELRFQPYLERAIFNVLTTKKKPNGTGFFLTPDGYAWTCYHVLKEAKKRPVYDHNNRFSIRFLGTFYETAAEWFPQFSNKKKDVAVVKVMVDRVGFPEFNTLPIRGDYHAGLMTCLRGFGWPQTFPRGYFSDAEVSSTEKEMVVNIYEQQPVQPDDSDQPQMPAKKMIKLTDGAFVNGMSGAPVIRKDTGHVFAVHGAWIKRNNWGLCISVDTFLKIWREYLPIWPDLAFKLI